MSSFADPRYVQQRIEKLERELEALKRASVPVLTYQKGPTPGVFNAARIGPGQGQKASMNLNMDGNQPGSAPRMTAVDPNGIVRAEIGNLAAVGNSPAQWGFRGLDASGIPIFDSQGLINVMTLLNSASKNDFITTTINGVNGPPNGITGAGGEVQVAVTTFNMPRLTTILILGFFTGIGWTSSGIIPLLTPIYIRVDGQASSAGGAVIHSNLVGGGGAPTSCSPYQLLTLPQGSYTVRMWWNSAGNLERLDIRSYRLDVFLLGG